MFNIAFDQLIYNLLPHFLRKERMLAWLLAVMKPVVLLYDRFLVYRTDKLYEARISAQVNSLEYMLNDAYYGDGNGRTIYITDNEDYSEDIYLYNSSELETETHLFNSDETADTDTLTFNAQEGTGGVDFIVWVLMDMMYDSDKMISRINKYKLAGTTYEIKTY